MSETRKDLSEFNARFVDTFSNMAESGVDSFSHKLHLMIEQYAQRPKSQLIVRQGS